MTRRRLPTNGLETPHVQPNMLQMSNAVGSAHAVSDLERVLTTWASLMIARFSFVEPKGSEAYRMSKSVGSGVWVPRSTPSGVL